ncbi:MAG TPA: hypothetical protein VFK52_00415 [Nocardioidaceae bacterium]|nr:hypothetical protein [Nocardioidaceae bacterium]
MSPRSKLISGLVGLAVLAPVGVVAARTVDVDLGLDVQADPLAYVEVVDEARPNTATPRQLLDLLAEATGRRWTVRMLQDWDPQLGGEPYSDNPKSRAELARSVSIPDADARVLGVATNTLATGEVARQGSLYVLWFKTPVDAQSWLRADQPVFVDPGVEERRSSYWAGSLAVYYAPPAATGGDRRDWSDAVLSSLQELAGA